MAAKSIKCLVLTPVGPKSDPDHVADTIASFAHYTDPAEAAMVVIDDTHSGKLSVLPDLENLLVLRSEELVVSDRTYHTSTGLLFCKQMKAIAEASRTYDWQCLLKLDDDALIIGPKPYEDALAVFSQRPDAGMLGAYRVRGDGTSKEVSLRRQGRRILKQLVSRSGLRHPRMMLMFWWVTARAKMRGYRLGDQCTGGAFFLSRDAYEQIKQPPICTLESIQHCWLPEDLLFSLFCAYADFRLIDFSRLDQVMAINWRGLPLPLDELVSRGKKIVHPVKDPDAAGREATTRRFFRKIRSDQSAQEERRRVACLAARPLGESNHTWDAEPSVGGRSSR